MSTLPPVSPDSRCSLGSFDSLGRLNVVIEAPRGGACRYRFSGSPGGFEIDGLQPRAGGAPQRREGKGAERAAAWRIPPFDIGTIPNALGPNGKRLEVLILDDAPATIGCVIPARFIGLVMPQANEKRNRGGNAEATEPEGILVTASALSSRFSCISNLEEVSSPVWDNIVRYYKNTGRWKEAPVRESAAMARLAFVKALERAFAASRVKKTPEEPKSVPKALEVGVALGTLFKRGVHLKSHANTLASGA